ncbi:MAG: hypothetical protein AB8G05_14090 [Oligoflexales bacterium]
MKYLNYLRVISSILLSSMIFSSCGKVKDGKLAAPKDTKDSHTKWLQLKDALKLTEKLEDPTRYLTDESLHPEYEKLIFEAAKRYNRDAFKTRCASIEGIRPLNIKRNKNIDIYLFEYKLQKNFAGEKEDQTRSAYLTIPKTQENTDIKFPLMVYSHGGDTGVSYTKELSKLDKLLEEYIILAPAFPGETLSSEEEPNDPNGEIWLGTKAVGLSTPWDNDVDDLLGAHDCLARDIYLNLEKPKYPSEKTHLVQKLANEINENQQTSIEEVLQDIRTKTKTYGADHLLGGVENYPLSVVMGASRGGLVASLAVAKSGAILSSALQANNKGNNNEGDNSDNRITLMDFVTSKGTLSKKSLAMFQHLGEKYGSVPPLFSGLATLSAPATVTIGSFRVILEQMVKGNTDLTVAKHLPGIRNLGHIFDRYLKTGDVEEAKFEIVLRDLSYVSPLIIAALKDWGYPAKGGSMLFIHGNKDKVVPVEQTQAAFNIFQNLKESEKIQAMTGSVTGIKVIKRIFDSQENLDNQIRFHLDDAFENSHSYHYSHLLQDQTLKAVMSSKNYDSVPKFISDIDDKLKNDAMFRFFLPPESLNKFNEVRDLYFLAGNAEGMRQQKVKALQASMKHIVQASTYHSSNFIEIDGEEHVTFTEQDIPEKERILEMLYLANALKAKEFALHLKSEELLHLAVLYQISNGGFKNGETTLDTGAVPKVVKLSRNKGDFFSLKEAHGPYDVVEAWGKMLK